jgi:hypothetical protein
MPIAPSAANVVAFTPLLSGGGCSMATARRTVSSNARTSATGSRSGSTRSVSVAMPEGTCGSAARSRTAAALARSSRVGDRGADDASIDRETSTTKST